MSAPADFGLTIRPFTDEEGFGLVEVTWPGHSLVLDPDRLDVLADVVNGHLPPSPNVYPHEAALVEHMEAARYGS